MSQSKKCSIYFEINEKVRKARSKWMYRLIKESEGQIYCLSKHLMQMSQSAKELGNRFVEKDDPKLAEECFNESVEWEAIFFILNDFDKEEQKLSTPKKKFSDMFKLTNKKEAQEKDV